jgi:hypothetical protein
MDFVWNNNPAQREWEMKILYNIVKNFKHDVIVEIGVESGLTLDYWEELADTAIGIDINPQRGGQRDNVIIGDSTDDGVIRELEAKLAGREIDFLFIDGNHDYEFARADYENYSRFVAFAGLIGFHDIFDMFDKVNKKGRGGGVGKLWNELKWGDAFIEISRDPDAKGIGVIQYVPSKHKEVLCE